MRAGGWSRQTTIREIPASTDLALVNMRLKAGAVRELHWHKPDEWGFVLKGRVRITAIDEDGHAFQDDVGEGDIWNFPGGIPHSIQGLEGDGCEFLLVFNDGNFNEDCDLPGHGLSGPHPPRGPRQELRRARAAPSPTSPRRSSTSSSRKCPARSPRIGSSAPGRCPRPTATG